MSQASSASTGLKVGDKVWVSLPIGRGCGTVVEDRGPIGRNGRHLFRVIVPNDPYGADDFLVGEDDVEHLTKDEEQNLMSRLSPAAIQDYLIHGGLVSMLVNHSPEPVWLRPGPQGSLTYTYVEGYSMTGGDPAPTGALFGEKIFSPKRNAVLRFIKSFGLNDADAHEVVHTIGVAP